MSEAQRFACTARGAIAAGRRRLKILLWGLGLLMFAVAVATWAAERPLPAILALVVALVAWTAWRMSTDLHPLWLEFESGRLTVQTRRQRIRVALTGETARRLTDDEIRHLERLASAAGVVAGTGGFDSHKLGEFDLYASNLENAVLIEAGESRL
ncbi:MAG: hypothetical protein V3T81_05135, partial [Thermoanaerobaculia bacterium]